MDFLSQWLRHVLDHDDEDIFQQPVYDAFWEALQPSADESLLAINCTHTELLRSAYNRGLQAYGIHRKKQEMDLAQTQAPHATLRLWEGSRIPYRANSFNYIFEFDSFLCFDELEIGLSEVKRVLKDGGVFIALVPNKDFLLSSRYSLSNKTTASMGYIDRPLKEWKHLFSSTGFTIKEIKKDHWFVRHKHRTDKSRAGSLIKVGVKDLLISTLPIKYAHRFVFFLKNESTLLTKYI